MQGCRRVSALHSFPVELPGHVFVPLSQLQTHKVCPHCCARSLQDTHCHSSHSGAPTMGTVPVLEDFLHGHILMDIPLLFAVVFVSLCSTPFCSFGNPANNVFSPAGLTTPGCKINPVPLSGVWRRGGAPYGPQSHHITETKSSVGRRSAPVMCWLGRSGRFSTHRDKPLSFSGSSFPLYVSAWLRCSHVMLLYPP